ncbi:MAG: hypothetical protein ACR2NS_11135 [Gemmatimonadaceae bacterium]
MIAHLSEKPRLDTTEWDRMSSTNAALDGATFSTLDAFASRMTRQGVTTVLMPPSILDLQYRREQKNIDRVFSRISRQATGRNFQVLGTPAEFTFPARLMFDTQYHLNRDGRALRTQSMLDLLTEAALNR